MPVYPSFDIAHLAANKLPDNILNADKFKTYLSDNPHLKVPHTHLFYHIVFFTKGSGEHTIDFVRFPVRKGMIYFMRPGQIHHWQFKGDVDGFIVNFSADFFNRLFFDGKLIEQFPVLGLDINKQVVQLSKRQQLLVEEKFESIVNERSGNLASSPIMIATLLLQILILACIDLPDNEPISEGNNRSRLLRDFQELIERNYLQMRLPKEYAPLLFVTPHQLNTICKERLGASAGEVIRNRVLLEAKRLLINFDLPIGEIANRLNFPDHSYFVKFFKKYTAITPESFRKKNYK